MQLCNHPNRRKVKYVLDGLRNGFRLGFDKSSLFLKSAKANGSSVFEHPQVIDDYLAKEVLLGRVFGHTNEPALKSLKINRFGVIPIKDRGWRLILDLSFLFEFIVNGGINKEDFPLSYSKVSNAIALIFKAGRGALMG